MRWTAADVAVPLLLWFHQGMMQQHPPPAVGGGVDGGGEQQDDGGLLHPPHPEDDPLPQYFQILFWGFLGFFETGGYLFKTKGLHTKYSSILYSICTAECRVWKSFCRTRGRKSLPARPKTASPFLIPLALMEGTHRGLSALNSNMSFFLCDFKVSGFMEVL
jgi:hypothetical protein